MSFTFDLLKHPIIFRKPRRLNQSSAWLEHIPFAMLLVDVLQPDVLVELGTQKGDSYCAFCEAVEALGLGTRCCAVDTWTGDPHSGPYGPDVLAELRRHHDPLYDGFSQLIQGSFDEALAHFADGSIDLLHIDGYHTYEAVRHDFEAWRPKLSHRGVVLLHDVGDRDFGAWRAWAELKRAYPSFEFGHAHGLGMLGVGDMLPDAIRPLFALSRDEALAVQGCFFRLGQRLRLLAESEASERRLAEALAERDQSVETLRGQIEQLHAATAEQVRGIEWLKGEVQRAEAEAAAWEREAAVERLKAEAGQTKVEAVQQERDRIVGTLHDVLLRSRDSKSVSRRWWPGERMLRFARLRGHALRVRLRRGSRPGLQPMHEVRWVRDLGVWESTGSDPWFLLTGPRPEGWAEMTFEMEIDDVVAGRARLYVDRGEGYNERDSYDLGAAGASTRQFVWLGPETVRVRLDPCASRGRFRIHVLTLIPVTARRARVIALPLGTIENSMAAAPRRDNGRASSGPSIQSFLERTSKDRLDAFLTDPTLALIFPAFPDPVVSIVIPTFNKAEYLYQCLESLLANTDVPFEVIVVDDASQDVTPELLDRLKNVTCVRNDENLEFIRTCNRGIRLARGRYLVFLNNDVIVTSRWLSTLVETMERDPRYGAVYGKLVRPDGTLQEAGSIVWRDGSTLGYGRDDDPAKPEYSYLREVDYGSAACLLVRADLVHELGGFDERYLPAYYEDTDLCFGVRRLGRTVVFQPEVSVIHCEFGSRSRPRAEALCAVNQPKFAEKWASELPSQFRYGAVLRARDRRPGKRVLVMDDQIPAPHLGSGFPRAHAMLQLLAEAGFVITFVPLTNGTAHQPTTQYLQQLGIEVFHGEALRAEELLEDRAGYYDVVVVSRPHNGAKMLPLARRHFPRARIVYDAEALFCIRDFLRAELEGRPLSDGDKQQALRQELGIMRHADVVMTVSESERELVLREQAHSNVVVWGHTHDVREPVTPFTQRRDVLFVGGFGGGDGPNTDAVVHFATTLFPRIRERLPHARFVIAGSQPPSSIRDLASPHIVVAGYVEDLTPHYETCRVFVVPIRFAAGISMKLTEAMSAGIPAVVSAVGAAGLDLHDGREVLIAHSDDELVDKVVQAYEDESLWATLQRAGQDYIRAQCAPDVMRDTLVDALGGTGRPSAAS